MYETNNVRASAAANAVAGAFVAASSKGGFRCFSREAPFIFRRIMRRKGFGEMVSATSNSGMEKHTECETAFLTMLRGQSTPTIDVLPAITSIQSDLRKRAVV